MKRNFWDVVPQRAKTTALILFALSVLIGLAIGFSQRFVPGFPVSPLLFAPGAGLLMGAFIAIWALCLGYVYADARRRAMPPIPWTLIAALVPNLLGFLFYFALRRPVVAPCPQCGQPIYTGQRFCAFCGFNTLSSNPGSTPPPSPSSGLNSSLV